MNWINNNKAGYFATLHHPDTICPAEPPDHASRAALVPETVETPGVRLKFTKFTWRQDMAFWHTNSIAETKPDMAWIQCEAQGLDDFFDFQKPFGWQQDVSTNQTGFNWIIKKTLGKQTHPLIGQSSSMEKRTLKPYQDTRNQHPTHWNRFGSKNSAPAFVRPRLGSVLPVLAVPRRDRWPFGFTMIFPTNLYQTSRTVGPCMSHDMTKNSR